MDLSLFLDILGIPSTSGEERRLAGFLKERLSAPEIASGAAAGQFVNVYCSDSSRLLPRPISLAGIDRDGGVIRLVYRVSGAGTEEFSRLEPGDKLELLGPLGNGFPLGEAKGKRVFLIGGGIGIPPMLETARRLSADAAGVVAVLGYRDELFLREDFPCEVVIATEDGSSGTKGNVLDAIRARDLHADVIFACGPAPMLRALKLYAQEKGIQCWLSMEEKMACGIGACLSCVCGSAEIDEHSQVKNKRVCTEGPVFLSTEIEF